MMARWLLLSAVLLVAACGGSSSGNLGALDTPSPDLFGGDQGSDEAVQEIGPADVAVDASADVAEAESLPPDGVEADAAEPVDVTPDAPGEIDVPEPPVLACALVTAAGLVADEAIHLTLADEPAVYVETAGFQVDVQVSAQNVEAGRLATLSLAGIDIATRPFASNPANGVAEVTFADVSLDHDLAGTTLVVTVTNAAGLEGSCGKTLTVDTGLCAVALAPAPGDGCLLVDAEPSVPGFQAVFMVSSPSDGCTHAALEVAVDDGPAQQTAPVAVDADGVAGVVVTVSEVEAGLNGLRLQVTGLAMSPDHPERVGATNVAVFHVDTDAPVVTLSSPQGGVVDLSVDADGLSANGLQLDVQGTVTGLNPGMLGDVLELTTTSGPSLELAEPAEAFLFDDVSFAADGLEVVRVQATDACGQVGAAEVALEVFTRRPALAVLEPAEGATLFSKNDLNPATAVYEADFLVAIEQLPAGRTLVVRCRPVQGVVPDVEVGRAVVPTASTGVVAVPVVLDVGVLTSAVACVASHDYPNASQSAARAFTLAMPAPALALVRPPEGRVTRKASLTLEVVALHLEGRAVDLTIKRAGDGEVVVERSGFVTIANGGAVASVDLADLPDGAYVLGVDASDGFGNVLSDQPGLVLHRTFVVDRSPPSVTISAPADLTFDEALAPDQDDGIDGYQNTLTFAIGGEPSPVGTTLCVSVNHQGATCAVVTSPAGTLSMPGFTFVAGANPVLAIATDVAGNPSAPGDWILSLLTPGPRVEFVQPSHDVAVATPALPVRVKVTNGATTEAYEAATVTLRRDGEDVDTATAGAAGVYALAATLVEGRNTLQARAVVDGVAGFSYPLTVTYKTTVPGAAFEAPVDGAVYNATSPACAAGAGPCLTEVRATTTNAEDGSAALLTTLCGAASTTYPSSVVAGALRFDEVLLPDQATCLLTIELVDALGTEAQAGPVTVRVDRVRPRLLTHDVPAYVLKKDDADPVLEGVQVRVRVTVAGLEAGQEISLAVTDGDGATTIVSQSNSSAVPDSSTGVRVFETVTLPEGSCTIEITASDLAGNAAIPLVASSFVVGSQPKVWVYQPEFVVDAPCSADDACGAGACVGGRCYLPWNRGSVRSLQVGSQGIPRGSELGDTLRVCSSGAGADAPPCQTAGYGVVTAAALDQDFFGVNLGALADGAHRVIVEALGDPAADRWVTSDDPAIEASGRYRMIFQDTVAPQAGALSVLSDTLAPAGVLNRAERAADGRFSLAVQGSEDGTAALFVGGLQVAEAPMAGGNALFATHLDEGSAYVQARVRDRVGNQGPLTPEPGLTVSVDTVAPLVQFVNPAEAVLNAADSADVIVRSGEAGVRVALADGATPLGVETTGADFRATFSDVLASDGSYVLGAVGTDWAENTTAAATVVPVVVVDRTPPTLGVAAPADVSVQDDADAAPGFQVVATLATSGAVLWRVLVARGCSSGFTDCSAPSLLAEGSVVNPEGPEPPVLLTLPGASTTHYVLTFEAEDVHGNVAAEARRVSMNVSGCVVTIAHLPDSGFVNTSYCQPAGHDCASVTTSLYVSYLGTCPGVTTFQLFEDGVAVAAQDAIEGHAIFGERTWADGQHVTLEVRARADAVEVASSGVIDLTIDLTSPVVAFVASDVLGFTTPASGDTPTYGLADDQDAGLADLQIAAQIRVSDDLLDGGVLDRLETLRGGVTTTVEVQSPVLPAPLGASPFDVPVQGLTLSHGKQTVTAIAFDVAGNEGRAAFTADVDLQAPAPVALAALLPDEIDRRLPRVVLRWTAPGDDGAVGLATAYDVRFSRGPITDAASFEAACPVGDVTSLDPVAVPQAPGQAEALELRGPDVRPAPTAADPARCKFVVGQQGQVLTFAVRAIDDAGNASPITADQVVSSADLALKTARVLFEGPLQDEKMDRLFTPLGDINRDGLADFSTYSNTLGVACVVLGRNDGTADRAVPDLAFATDLSDSHRCFAADPGTTYVGVTAAGLGDLDGDGIGDWAMGYGSTPERVDVFLGLGAAPSVGEPPIAPTPFLRIRGQAYAATPSASQVFQVGDFDGDGLADIGVGSRLANKLYLVLLDRSFTQDPTPLWQPGDAPLEIDLQAAATYGAARVVRVTLTDWTDATSYFGMNAARAGNMLPQTGDDATPPEEVAIYQQNSPNQVFLLRGRPVPTSPVDLYLSAAYNGSAANNLEVVRFWREVGTTEGLFGIDLSGGTDLDGGGLPDLVIGHYSQAQKHADKPYAVYVIYGEAIQGELGIHLNGVKLPSPAPAPLGEGVLAGQYGIILQGPYRRPAILGDFDGAADGTADLLLHDLSATAWGAVWVRLNGIDPGQGLSQGTFPFVDLTLTSPYPAEPAGAYGNTAFPLSDFNGDGFPDILIGVKGGGFPTIVY